MKFVSNGHSLIKCLVAVGLMAWGLPGTTFSQPIPTQTELEAHLRFLADDALQGRKVGEPGNQVATAYLASYFEAHGLKPLAEAPNYLQDIPMERYQAPGTASLTLGDRELAMGKECLIMAGTDINASAEVVFAGHGWVDAAKGLDDYADKDVAGKIVLVNMGIPKDNDPLTILSVASQKRALAKERGALALIELYRMAIPWNYGRSRGEARRRLQMVEGAFDRMPYLWLDDPMGTLTQQLEQQKVTARLRLEGGRYTPLEAKNVVGWVEGRDPRLKEEFLLVSAHFDHVGAGNSGGRVTASDSIFNGARDNAIGTTALLATAKAFAADPPRRSVLFLGANAEEMGMVGSNYFAQNPPLPLDQVVFNLNCDGAGYNDTSRLSVVGFEHVDLRSLITEGAAPVELEVGGDVAPGQNFFDRSDNVSFAKQGIPALNISPGIRELDQAIMQYYHQVADEAESLNFSYVTRFCQAFVNTARLLADREAPPFWKPESKYFGVGKALYKLDD